MKKFSPPLRLVVLSFPLILFYFQSFAQNNSPKIVFELNHVIGLFSFIETAVNAPYSSASFHNHINAKLGNDPNFQQILEQYKRLNLEYYHQRPEYPKARHSSRSTKDFIWIAASNSKNLNDFSNRIIGFLPLSVQHQFLDCFRQIEKYYDSLVWKSQLKNLHFIKEELEKYGPKMEQLFLRVSNFYGTPWDTQQNFKVILCPIPLAKGETVAFPQGNVIISTILSKNKDIHLSKLGVIIHEMCHILYNEQAKQLQHKIDTWFSKNLSDYSQLSYQSLDEGLATAIGNGWAHRELTGKENNQSWYNNSKIDTYAHNLYALSENYLNDKKTIDQAFIDQAIKIFASSFPQASQDLEFILKEVSFYANVNQSETAHEMAKQLRENFPIQGMNISSPINDPRSIQTFGAKKKTKLLMIMNNHKATLEMLKEYFEEIKTELNPKENFIHAFKAKSSQSNVIILNVQDEEHFTSAIKYLKEKRYIEYKTLRGI